MTHPGQVFAYLATEERFWYLWQLFAPLAFVAWWAPSVLLIATGPLALNLISNFHYQFDVRHHYSTLVFPALVVATIFGVASAPSRHRHAIVGVIVAASIGCAYLWSPTPGGRVHPAIADPGSTSVASFRRGERLIPKNAVVSAYHQYVPQPGHRQEIYMFPNPWRASYWGTFEQEGQRLPQADRLEYLIVPVQLSTEAKAVLDAIRSEFTLVYNQDAVQLFVRRP